MDGINGLSIREILVRKPFFRTLPMGYGAHGGIYDKWTSDSEPEDNVVYRIATQADFLREYYPSSHLINDPKAFPDVVKQDPDSKKWYTQPVTRTAFAFQQIIATKQIVHLCGNDIQMELMSKSRNEAKEQENVENLAKFREGWLEKSMDIRFYESVRSVKITGDTAFVGFVKDGKFGGKTLSYLNGDTLYPHCNSITGELELFARKYYDYDEDGRKITEWVEVWDDKYIYRAKRSSTETSALAKIAEKFGLHGYGLVSKKPHGFSFVPVAYHRCDDGACWGNSQDTIEKYEEAFSYFCENNKAFAFPIIYFKGEDVDIHGDLNGSVKSISMDTESEAGFLQHQDVSTSFNTELMTLYKLIYEQSFAVQPPELKSGDLPGVAVKLLFSPAIEKAIQDACAMQGFLEKMITIFKHGYGYEINMEATLVELGINAWIEPYIHQNVSELTANLATAVQNNFLSKQTASERVSMYSKNDEFDRIMREEKKAQEMDLLNELKKQDNQTENNIEQQEAVAKIQAGEGGQDVNTGGGGGRPNESGRLYDKNGNWPGRNNWEK